MTGGPEPSSPPLPPASYAYDIGIMLQKGLVKWYFLINFFLFFALKWSNDLGATELGGIEGKCILHKQCASSRDGRNGGRGKGGEGSVASRLTFH